nr:hypothetical protein [Tanacetum cinerariifolium]
MELATTAFMEMESRLRVTNVKACFNQPPQYSIDHQEDLTQQRISNVHDRWDKLNESQNELLNMMQSFYEMYPEIHPPYQEISDEVFQANYSAQHKEYPKNSSNEIVVSNSNQEKEGPPQDFDIRQLIREECGIEVYEEKKQKMEDTILELVKICHQKELLCMHDNVDDLIESALNSKLLSINSQRLDKEKQEVKNFLEQSTKRRTRIIESLQNFRVIHKSSTSLKNTSQISSVHAIASILSTKEPEYSPSMGYEHPNTTSETESDEIIKSGVEELVPILSECEVTSEDESKYDMPIQDQSSSVFTTFLNPLFKDNDNLTFSDDESLSEEDVPIEESKVHSNPLFDNDEINSDELDELAHNNPENTEFDFDFKKEIHLIENLLYDNSSPRPPKELNAEIANTNVESIPSSLISVQDNDSQREEINVVTNTNDVLPPGFENDDSNGEVDDVKELLVDNSIPFPNNESSESDFDNPSVPLPLSEPPDIEFDFKPDSEEEILVVTNDNDKLKYLYPRDEFDDDNYSSFTFLICFKMFLSFLSAESEDTIFDPIIFV